MNTWLVGLLVVTAPCSCVQILSLSVPGVVEAGVDDVVLDCDFNYTEEEKNHLSIMWYFDNEPEPERPIYMWLPGVEKSNEPKVISDMFREHLDLGFAVNQEPFSKHRALHIKNPTPQLSGTYRCKVSTLTDEDFQQKDLLVYSPPSKIEFDEIVVSDSGPVNVTCVARGMYPKPEARLTWRQNSSKIELETTSSVIHKREDGLFDVTLSTTIDNDSLSLQVTTIDCEVSLSGTEYSILQQAVLSSHRRSESQTDNSVICLHSSVTTVLTLVLVAVLH